jgi:hypothetical protein
MALDTNVPAILQVVVDPSGAESGAAKVSAAVGKMTDTSLKFLQTMQTGIDGTFKNLSKTNAFSSLATSSQSSFDRIASAAKTSFDNAASTVKAFWSTFTSEAKKGMDKNQKDQESWISGFTGRLLGLTTIIAAVFSVEALSSFVSKMYDVNNVYNAFLASVSITTGSIAGAKAEFQYLFNLSQNLGVEVESLTKSYTKFSAAVHGTALEGKGAKEIFEAISMASTVLHMHGHDTELMFYAITQSISKGRISREELVRQLAEKLPRAFGLAATAMYPLKSLTEGMAQLNKDLTAGTIPMNEFFLKFSKVIKEEYGPAAEIASHMVQASVNRMKNSVLQFFIEVGQSKAMDAFSKLAEIVSQVLDSSSTAAEAFGSAIGGMVDNITSAIALLSARDVDAMLRGVTQFIQGLGLAFDVVATGLGGVKTEGSGFLNFTKAAADMVIVFSGAVTQLITGLKLLGNYLIGPEKTNNISVFSTDFKGYAAEQAKNLKASQDHLAERKKLLADFANTSAATNAALLKNQQNYNAAVIENNKVSNTPFANTPKTNYGKIGIPTDADLKAIYGNDPVAPNAKALREEATAAKKLAGEYETLMSRISEKQDLAAAQIDSTVKITAAEKTEIKFMHDLNALHMSQKDDRYIVAAAMIHQTKVLEDKAVAELKEIANLKAYEAATQFHLNAIGTKTEKTLEDIKAMELSIAVHGKTEDQLFATADARLADESAAYSQAAAIQTLNGAAEKDIKFLLDMADATDTLRAARKQLNDKRLELESVKAAAETQKEWDKVFNSMEGRAKSLFTSIGSKGLSSWKDMLQGMVDLFRTTLLDYIYASFAKPFVINIIGSVAGSLGATGIQAAAKAALGSASTGGGTLSGALSTIKSLTSGFQTGLSNSIASVGGWISSLGSNGTGAIADGLSSLGSSITLGSEAIANALPFAGALFQLATGNVSGAIGTGIGAAIGSVVPVLGTALGGLIGGFIGNMFDFGGTVDPSGNTSGTFKKGVRTSRSDFSGWGDPVTPGIVNGLASIQDAFASTLSGILEAFGKDSTVVLTGAARAGDIFQAHISGTAGGKSVGYAAWEGQTADLQAFATQALSVGIANAIQNLDLSAAFKKAFAGITDPTAVNTMLKSTYGLIAAQARLSDAFGLTVDQAIQVANATGLVGDALAGFMDGIATAAGSQSSVKLLMAARSNLITLLGADLPSTLAGFDDIIKGIDKSNATGIAQVAKLLSVRAGFEQYTSAMAGLKGGVSGATFSMRTPQAQSAMLKTQLNDMFGVLGLAVPKSAAELVALGDSINYTTENGLTLAAAFPDLAKAFAATQTQVDALNSSMTVSAGNFASLLDYNRYTGVAANYGGAFANDYAYSLGSGAVTQNGNGTTSVSGPNQDIVAVLQALRADINATMTANAVSSAQTAKLLKLWNGDGMPPTSTRTV